MAEETSEGLRRALGLGQASSIVVGIVIGSGIFVGANRVAQGVDAVWGVFAVWIGMGLLTLLGALTYAEFGAMFPRSGGDYVYAGESLGRFWGFFNGWLAFAINYPASLAALALAWAGQLEQLKPGTHRLLFFGDFSLRFTAIALLGIFAIVNYFGVKQGGWAQFVITSGKVALILGLVLVGLFSPDADASHLGDSGSAAPRGLYVALVAALFAYDGWTGVSRVAGEVKDPQRNVPRALILGMLGVVTVYVLVNLAYLFVLGFDGMRGTGLDPNAARAIASRTGEALFGGAGKVFVSVLILASILGPINGITLAGPRVYYAMARDGLFPRMLARIHDRHRVPHVSILFQGLISALLVLFFTFEQLVGYVVLASWTAYALTGVALIVLRIRDPHRPRPYRVPGYPVVPVLFVLLSVAFVVYLLWDSLGSQGKILGLPTDFFYFVGNLVVMALAVPVYLAFVRRAGASRLV